MADYFYNPLFGVEPYKDVAGVGIEAAFGGGADITGQNLLVSLWAVDDPAAVSGRLFKPERFTSEFVNVIAPAQEAEGVFGVEHGYMPALEPSRTSASFMFNRLTEEGTPSFTFPILAILNPPGEIKNYYIRAFKAVLDATYPSGLRIDVYRSFFLRLVWQVTFETFGLLVETSEGEYNFGNGIDGVMASSFPFALSSGADGIFPHIPEAPTPSQMIAYADQVIAGEFFIPVLLLPAVFNDIINLITINMRHSLARI